MLLNFKLQQHLNLFLKSQRRLPQDIFQAIKRSEYQKIQSKQLKLPQRQIINKYFHEFKAHMIIEETRWKLPQKSLQKFLAIDIRQAQLVYKQPISKKNLQNPHTDNPIEIIVIILICQQSQNSNNYQKMLVSAKMLKATGLPLLRMNLTPLLKYSYIRKKELDLIKGTHGDSWYELMKVYTRQAKYIYKQGWAAFKHDFKTFYQLKKKLRHTPTPLSAQDKKQHKRMRQQLQRLKTLVIIQILPFSGVLLLFYVYAYPTSIPSWFTVDTYYERYQRQCISNQQAAIEYFKLHPLKTANLRLSELSTEEIKKLCELLFGHYQDGVVGYNKVLPNRSKEYLFTPRFSKYLLLRNLRRQFKEDIHNFPQLQGLDLQNLVLWKYQKVMNLQQLILFEPIDESEEPPKDK